MKIREKNKVLKSGKMGRFYEELRRINGNKNIVIEMKNLEDGLNKIRVEERISNLEDRFEETFLNVV